MEMKTYSVTFQEILEIIENYKNRKFGTVSKIVKFESKIIKKNNIVQPPKHL